MKSNTARDESRGGTEFLWAALRASLIGTFAAVLLALIFSAAALAMTDPDKLVGVFGYAALFWGAALTGIVSVKLDSGRSLLAALVGGVGYVLILWLISLFFRAAAENAVSPLIMALMYAGCIAVSMLGGLMGRGKKRKIGASKNNPTDIVRKQLGRL